jgi:BRCT domain type II-containing protein
VLTGVFPEVGGGGGLNLGKARVTAMIASFGGRVTSAVSGVTDLLVVGKAPGTSKVRKARARNIQLLDLSSLVDVIEGSSVANSRPVVITSFSSGCR